jgi:hypothetical protein
MITSLVVAALAGTSAGQAGGFDCGAAASGPTLTLPNLLSCRHAVAPEQRELVRNGSAQILFIHLPKAGGTTAEQLLAEYACRRHRIRQHALRERGGIKKADRKAEKADAQDWEKALLAGKLWRTGPAELWLQGTPAERAETPMLFSKASVHADEVGPDAGASPLANEDSTPPAAPPSEPLTTRIMATVFRDPVERIVSHYRYLIGSVYNEACTTRGQQGSIFEFAEWYARWRGTMADISNYEVRLLVSRQEDPSLYHSADNEFHFHSGGRGCKPARPLPPVTAAHLEIATARLRRMSLIGLVSEMDLSMALWRTVLALDDGGAVGDRCSVIKSPSAAGAAATAAAAGGAGGGASRKASVRVCGNAGHRICGNATGVRQQLLPQHPETYQQLLWDNRLSVILYNRAKALFEQQLLSARKLVRAQFE